MMQFTEESPAQATLYGLGVGPGDPELMTLKAVRILRDAPVIAWPAPLEGPSMARQIAAPHIPEGRIEVAIRMPIADGVFPVDRVYDRAARELGQHLDAGRDVAVLCEGDPFFYGSFMYLFARLGDARRVVVVPGISSLTATAAALGTPLAARNDGLIVLPAPLPEEELVARMVGAEAVALIKLGRHLAKARRALTRAGLAAHANYIAHATMESQHCCPLSAVADGTAPYFSMILAHRRGRAWQGRGDG